MRLLFVLYTIVMVSVPHFSYTQVGNVVAYESLLKAYLSLNKFSIDTTAQAIILSEQGYSTLTDNVMEYHVERTIKFLGDEAIADLGVINIPHKDRTYISRIEGTTYNLEGDQIIEQSIKDKDILRERINDNTSVSKFTLPGIRKGSIIHYSYSIFRHATLLVPSWYFQNDYPTLYSEYKITLPSSVTYNAIERFNVPVKAVSRKKDLANCDGCSYYEVPAGSHEISQKWVRKNIPAFKREPYTSSEDNFKERIKINIVTIQDNGFKIRLFNNWEDFTKKYFFGDPDLGGQIFASNSFLKEKTEEIIRGQVTELDKARAIFSYVRDHYTSTAMDEGDGVQFNIKDVFQRKTGSPEGINLLLTAMLRKANLDSEPVLLTTREGERLNSVYIDPGNINYIVNKTIIDGQMYLSDASGKYNPFNVLPSECYNGYCRTINKNGGTALILDPDNIRNKTTIIVKLMPTADTSKLLLKVDKQYGTFTAIALRKLWGGDTAAVRNYIARELNTGSSNVLNMMLKNLDDPEQPLNLHYETLIDFDYTSGTIYLDPYFAKFFVKNPLPQAKRQFNIEMDYLEDINYFFNFEIPTGFILDDYPKSAILQYKDNQMIVMKNIMEYNDQGTKTFSLNSRFTTKTTLFSPEDYESLRNFYERVMEEQAKKIIIKKIN